MSRGISYVHKQKNIQKIPSALPILLVSGADDPVGDFGKGIQKAYDAFWQNGIKAVQMKLYENDRHEILNETDYMTVYEDIWTWIKGKLS